MNNTALLSAEQKAKILANDRSLRAMRKTDLAAEYVRVNRVCNTKGVDKETLVMGILEARFGSRRVDAAFAA